MSQTAPISSNKTILSPVTLNTAPSASTDWLTAREAAFYLKVKVRTVLLWARQGKVKAYALSGTKRHVWRFRAEDLDAMLVGPSVPCSKGAQ